MSDVQLSEQPSRGGSTGAGVRSVSSVAEPVQMRFWVEVTSANGDNLQGHGAFFCDLGRERRSDEEGSKMEKETTMVFPLRVKDYV